MAASFGRKAPFKFRKRIVRLRGIIFSGCDELPICVDGRFRPCANCITGCLRSMLQLTKRILDDECVPAVRSQSCDDGRACCLHVTRQTAHIHHDCPTQCSVLVLDRRCNQASSRWCCELIIVVSQPLRTNSGHAAWHMCTVGGMFDPTNLSANAWAVLEMDREET